MSDLFVDNIKHQSSQGSGTITLGASGETIALASGATAGFGKIAQVIQSTNSTSQTFSTLADTASSLSVSITPSSTSSKILIFASCAIQTQPNTSGADHGCAVNLRKGASIVLAQTRSTNYNAAGNTISKRTINIQYLDSPATTSATTYTISINPYQNNGGSTVIMNVNFQGTDTSVITAMEILP